MPIGAFTEASRRLSQPGCHTGPTPRTLSGGLRCGDNSPLDPERELGYSKNKTAGARVTGTRQLSEDPSKEDNRLILFPEDPLVPFLCDHDAA